jgi:hypothetical protein
MPWRPARINKLPPEAAHILNQAIREINGRIDDTNKQIRPRLKSTSKLVFGSIPANSSKQITVNIFGANTTGTAHASPAQGVTLGSSNLVWSAAVSGQNQVKVTLTNPTTSPITVNTIPWNVIVLF